ncbi:MAG: YceI family protein [Chloroflexi bacterium]|nr:YceI family protein [Chloroflexota bacterium]
MALQTQAEQRTTWQIDAAHSVVEFAVKHLMLATAKGRFASVNGTVVADEADRARSTVEVTIDAASIDTRSEQRDGHLRSPDFLDVERYPTITFRSRRVEPLGGDRLRVAGDLTVRDVTREVVLDAAFHGRAKDPWGNERVGFSAQTTIDRRDFGATWNVPLAAGGVLVGNEVKIGIEVEAVRQG